MKNLTPEQKAVYRYVCKHIKKHGYSPTVREIATAMDWESPNAAQHHLRTLVRLGCLKKTPRGYLNVTPLPVGWPR